MSRGPNVWEVDGMRRLSDNHMTSGLSVKTKDVFGIADNRKFDAGGNVALR